MLCSLGVVRMAFGLLDRSLGRVAAVFASLYLALDSAFLIVSRTFQVDIPWLAFSFASFCLLLRFHRTGRRRDVVGSAALFAVSVLLKANPLLVPVIIAYFLLSVPGRGLRSLTDLGWYLLLPVILLLAAVRPADLAVFCADSVGSHAAHVGLTIDSWATGNRWLFLSYEFPVLLLDLVAAAGLAGGAYRSRNRLAAWLERSLPPVLALVWLAVTAVAFSLYHRLFPHHFVFLILPAVLLAGDGARLGFDLLRGSRLGTTAWAAVLLTTIAYGAFFGGNSLVDILRPQENRYDRTLASAAAYVRHTTAGDDYVVADDQIVLYLADRNTPPNLVDTSFVRIESRILTADDLAISLRTYRPAVVALVSGRLASMPGLSAVLAPDYTEHALENGAKVFRRRESAR